MKVFIADDSNSVIERLTDLLEEIPGTQLVGVLGMSRKPFGGCKNEPDALILDLQMPGGSALMYFVQSAQSIPIFKL